VGPGFYFLSLAFPGMTANRIIPEPTPMTLAVLGGPKGLLGLTRSQGGVQACRQALECPQVEYFLKPDLSPVTSSLYAAWTASPVSHLGVGRRLGDPFFGLSNEC